MLNKILDKFRQNVCQSDKKNVDNQWDEDVHDKFLFCNRKMLLLEHHHDDDDDLDDLWV